MSLRLTGCIATLCAAVVFGASPKVGVAANKYWNPSSGNSWKAGANWSPSGVPGSGDTAIFDGNTNSANCTLDATVNVAGMVLTNGYAGTVAQGGVAITLGPNGWSQSAGTFNAGDQTISLSPGIGVNASWTYSGGEFNAGSSTVTFFADNSTITVSGSQTFNNLTMNGVYQTHWANYTVPTGTTLTVTNTLSLLDGAASNAGFGFGGTGTIAAKGNITASCMRAGNGYGGTVLLLINGAGDQTFTNGGATMQSITIDKSGGTLTLVGTHVVSGGDWGQPKSWTYTAGTLNAGASTIKFVGENGGLTISGSHTLGNVSFVNVGGTHGNTITLAAGTTLTAAGTLTFNAGSGGSQISLNGGAINAAGNVSMSLYQACGGTAVFSFTGSATQQVSYSGTANYFRFNPVTINKTGGAVKLATDISFGNSGQQLVLTSGALDLSTNTLTVAGAVTIHPGATSLGLTVADTNMAGRLTCSSAIDSITNVVLTVSLPEEAKKKVDDINKQTYTVLSNSSILTAPFESVTFVGPWRGVTAYTDNGGKNVTLSDIRRTDTAMIIVIR